MKKYFYFLLFVCCSFSLTAQSIEKATDKDEIYTKPQILVKKSSMYNYYSFVRRNDSLFLRMYLVFGNNVFEIIKGDKYTFYFGAEEHYVVANESIEASKGGSSKGILSGKLVGVEVEYELTMEDLEILSKEPVLKVHIEADLQAKEEYIKLAKAKKLQETSEYFLNIIK